MSIAALDVLARAANATLATTSLAVAALIVSAMTRRPVRKLEPLGVAFCAIFLAIGLRAAVYAVHPARAMGGLAVADWIAALAAVAFLLCWRRYDLFIESADKVREYETGFAEQERAARALAQVNEELRRLDELKSEFLAVVSHELRTPLTAIIGYSRLLTRQLQGSLTPKQLDQIEAIFRSAQRLAGLINDLLDVSRLEAGRVELQPRPTSARQAVDQVLGVVRVAAMGKQITVTNALSPDLPSVHADPTRLQQVLVNLLGNAVKFTPAGGMVRVCGGVAGSQVWISVEDTGVGIAQDELARIWNAFYQVESPMRRSHGGSGLGLSIVRRLIELHGGIVRAESEGENRGSRFTFTLPISPAAPGRELVPAGDAEVERVLAGRRVLIVEDEPENQRLLRLVVEEILGGDTTVCKEGELGLVEALDHPPALILLDLMLPGLSGWEIARRLRQHARTREVPIIAVSALARPQERETALRAGCDAYVAKPFSLEEIARVIVATLSRERMVPR